MTLQIRRGTDADRLTITPESGELIYTIDTKDLYVGDGIATGGVNIGLYKSTATVTFSATVMVCKFS